MPVCYLLQIYNIFVVVFIFYHKRMNIKINLLVHDHDHLVRVDPALKFLCIQVILHI